MLFCSDSFLALAQEPLTLRQIAHTPLPNAQFAYLSACQTAAGSPELPDEALHLAAGMLFSGYQGVIATMWSITDRDAPQVAKDVYNYLLADPQPDVQKAADALHHAVSRLHASSHTSPLSWAPFIHIGV